MNSPNQLVYQIRQYCRRARAILLNEGARVLMDRLLIRIRRLCGFDYPGNFDKGYPRWILNHSQPMSEDNATKVIDEMAIKPVFSLIVPVYNVDARWLNATIESVKSQRYPHWQLCLVDDASDAKHVSAILNTSARSDPRIQIKSNDKNLGIAQTSNVALSMAEGDYIALLDHDDELTVDALLHNALVVNKNPEVDLIYSDEDKISTSGRLSTPFFKPDFSVELLRGHNYIGHFVVVRKSLIDQIGGFRSGYGGAQDYDLILRISENTKHIKHIPKVLYHWREIPGSTATSFDSKSYAWDAGLKALEDHFQRQNNTVSISKGVHPGTYRVASKISAAPLVSIILPFRDQPKLLEKCLVSLFEKTTWPNLEVLAIDNNSKLDETQQLVKQWQTKEKRFQLLAWPQPFNYSAICNFGTRKAIGDFIVLLNSDIEFISSDWVEMLLEHGQQPDVGAVGGKLIYPNHTIQHGGIVVGIDGGAGHPFKHFAEFHKGYFMRLDLIHNVSAVTGALLMVSRDKYLAVGGLDESAFAVAYNDVDFCLKLASAGYRNLFTPHCKAFHHESSTRGYESDEPKRKRHETEKQNLQQKWPDYFDNGDPLYNPNLTLSREDYSLNFNQGIF